MSTFFKAGAGIVTMPTFMPDRRMHGSGYDYFVVRVAAVVFLDKGTA